MLCWRPELVALLLCPGLGLLMGVRGAAVVGAAVAGAGAGIGSVSGVASNEQQLELKLSALRVHKQLLQAEIGRLYMDTFTAETPLLLEELQQRQQEIQLQIELLEGKSQQTDAQHLAVNLAADFEYLQHKLDELKQQLQQLNAMQSNSSNISSSSNSKATFEQQRDVINSTPQSPVGAAASSVSSYFFTPLLAMPEFPSGSIAQPSQSSPSFIKRLLAMLRPNAAAAAAAVGPSLPSATSGFLRGGHWTEPSGKVQLLNGEELLAQLQLQRQFLDDAIKRLELLSVKQSDKIKPL